MVIYEPCSTPGNNKTEGGSIEGNVFSDFGKVKDVLCEDGNEQKEWQSKLPLMDH